MPIKNFTIELRVNHDDPSADKDELIRVAVCQAAQQLLTSAMLIQDRRKPQIAVQMGDDFAANEEIDIMMANAQAAVDEASAPPEPEPEAEKPPLWSEEPEWQECYDADYTVSGNEFLGYRFNDPNGVYSDVFEYPQQAWWAAAFHRKANNLGGNK